MKNSLILDKSFILCPEACDEISNLIMDYCGKVGTERKDAIRYSLSAEECMLYWMEHGCKEKMIRLHTGSYMFTPYIEIEVEGEPLNPYSEDDKDFGSYSSSFLSGLNLGPEYIYNNHKNRLRFSVKKKPLGHFAVLGIVVAAALAVGLTGMFLFPDDLRKQVLETAINPVYNTFFKILGCIAGPMIFLSVAWGVYGIGDAATFGRIGRKMMIRYVGTTIIVCACCSVFYPLLGPRLSRSSNTMGQIGSIVELILGVFPSTIIEPFATGNTLQIIVLAVVIGISLLYLGNKATSVARAIEQVNLIVQYLMVIISKLVPYMIFLIIINIIWSGNINIMISSWKLLAVLVPVLIIITAVFLIMTSVRGKVRIPVMIRKNMPTFLVALMTASSAAAFSRNVSTCEEKFGIDPSLIRFGIPLGMVMHKPICAVYNLLMVFFFAEKYGIKCSFGWIAIAIFICSIIAIATPPIPGGGAIAYSVIFAQMGIPDDAMVVALAIDISLDFLLTAFEMFILPLTLINMSCSFGMINKDVLRR